MSRLALPTEARAFCEVVNETFVQMRLEGSLPAHVEDWTIDTFRDFPGDKWVHPDVGRIDGVAVSTNQQKLRAVRELWQVFHILGVRSSVVLPADRELMVLRVLKASILANAALGCVGATCDVPANASSLRAFLASFPAAETEDHGSFVRVWFRHQVGFPEWERRAPDARLRR